MKRIHYTKLLYALIIMLFMGMMWSCTDEGVDDIPTLIKESKSVTVSVKIPGAGVPKSAGPTTYSLSEGEENEVKQIAVLLFDTDGYYTYQPIYINSAYITSDPSNSSIKTFTIKVPDGTYDMVILANANESLANSLQTINEEIPKATLLGKILVSNSGKWNAASSSPNYIHIPMWGEVKDITIDGNMSKNVSASLVRMIAKIDVALTTTAAKEQFNLQSIRLYNYNNHGQVVPNESNWNSATLAVIGSSIPSLAELLSTPLLYEGSSILKENNRGTSSISEIYTFEARSGNPTDLPNNTCLVIGGIYGNDAEPTYYRIDFGNTIDGTTTYLPLLRNHNYKINIVDVNGRGLSTPQLAFNSSPANIDANIISWDDAQITNIAFNGDYMLGVSKDAFSFTREVHNNASDDNELFVTTDYSSGWKVDKIVDAANSNITWMSLSPTTGPSGSTTNTRIATTENTTGVTRTGFLHLIAGPLRYVVKVEQLSIAKEGLSITIADINNYSITTLDFGAIVGAQPASKMFKLSWTPESSSLTYVNTSQGNPFIFSTAGGLASFDASGTISDASGMKTYAIQPTPITSAEIGSNLFYERSSTLLYTISDGVTAVFKTLIFRQFVYNVIPTVQPVYKMDGGRKSFSVRSNTPFTVSVKSDTKNVITLRTIEGAANTSTAGTPVYFDIKDDMTNPTVFQEDVVVTISSPTGLFPPKEVTLNCLSAVVQPKSNSYIVAPNEFGIMIPVSRANESMLGNQLAVGDAFTTEVVWTDNANRVAINSNIRVVKPSGVGSLAYLVVMPGSSQGNAVVAIKKSGKILWSWHIWVTNSAPTSVGVGKLMDRNLGAIGNTPGAYGTKGLLYQWGRKDPFPGSSTINGTGEPTIYNAAGTTSIAKPATNASENFSNSVANPASYYRGDSNNDNDWYSSSRNTHNDDLWGRGATKTIYDPCPAGWRVPENTVWNGLNAANFPWNSSTLGNTNNNYGGFYPTSGFRQASGTLKDVGVAGFYWSASVLGEKVRDLYTGTGNPSMVSSGSNFRGFGYSVRCVKE